MLSCRPMEEEDMDNTDASIIAWLCDSRGPTLFHHHHHHILREAVCDDTQNLNETESETFFRYQIFPIPNPILLLIPNTEFETI